MGTLPVHFSWKRVGLAFPWVAFGWFERNAGEEARANRRGAVDNFQRRR